MDYTQVRRTWFKTAQSCCSPLENWGHFGRKGSMTFLLEKEGGFWEDLSLEKIPSPGHLSLKQGPDLSWSCKQWGGQPPTQLSYNSSHPRSVIFYIEVWMLSGTDLKVLEAKAAENILEGGPYSYLKTIKLLKWEKLRSHISKSFHGRKVVPKVKLNAQNTGKRFHHC